VSEEGLREKLEALRREFDAQTHRTQVLKLDNEDMKRKLDKMRKQLKQQ
jgi:hypothetical protein